MSPEATKFGVELPPVTALIIFKLAAVANEVEVDSVLDVFAICMVY